MIDEAGLKQDVLATDLLYDMLRSFSVQCSMEADAITFATPEMKRLADDAIVQVLGATASFGGGINALMQGLAAQKQ